MRAKDFFWQSVASREVFLAVSCNCAKKRVFWLTIFCPYICRFLRKEGCFSRLYEYVFHVGSSVSRIRTRNSVIRIKEFRN